MSADAWRGFRLANMSARGDAAPALVLTPSAAHRAMAGRRRIPRSVAFWPDPDLPSPGLLASAVEVGRFGAARTGRGDVTRPRGFVVSSERAPDGRAEYVCMPMTRMGDGTVLGYFSFARALKAPRKPGAALALELWIDHLYVLPRHRGRGHGNALGAGILGIVVDDVRTLGEAAGEGQGLEIAVHADFVSEGGAALVTRLVERLACLSPPSAAAPRIEKVSMAGGW